jgi:hypothetical protein
LVSYGMSHAIVHCECAIEYWVGKAHTDGPIVILASTSEQPRWLLTYPSELNGELITYSILVMHIPSGGVLGTLTLALRALNQQNEISR